MISVESTSYGAAITLVIRVFDHHANVHVSASEVQVVIRLGVRGKPEALFDIFAIGTEPGEDVLIVLADQVGHSLAVGHHDLQVLAIYPHTALKVALFLFDDLGEPRQKRSSLVRRLVAVPHRSHCISEVLWWSGRRVGRYARRPDPVR